LQKQGQPVKRGVRRRKRHFAHGYAPAVHAADTAEAARPADHHEGNAVPGPPHQNDMVVLSIARNVPVQIAAVQQASVRGPFSPAGEIGAGRRTVRREMQNFRLGNAEPYILIRNLGIPGLLQAPHQSAQLFLYGFRKKLFHTFRLRHGVCA